jgi:hypothetical protein
VYDHGAVHSELKSWPRFTFLAATSLTIQKPRFRQTLRPMAARLAGAGVATNSELSKYLLSV